MLEDVERKLLMRMNRTRETRASRKNIIDWVRNWEDAINSTLQ